MKKQVSRSVFAFSATLLAASQLGTFAYADNPPKSYIDAVEAPSVTTKRQLRPSEAVERYRQMVEEVEAVEGAYGNGLDEHLIGLGSALQEMGAHEEAIDHFKRAMLVNRVNEGLYSLNQAPIIERMIESNIAMGNWEGATDTYSYLFWLNKKNFGENDPRMLPVINKLSAWHLQSYMEEKGGTMFEHLVNATNLYKLAVDIITNNFGEDDLRLVEALRGLKASNYYLATYRGEPAQTVTVNSNFGPGGDVPTAEQARFDHYKLNSFRNGRNAITRIVDVYQRNPDAPPAASARAQVELADWYMMFNKWSTARRTYEHAYQALWDNGATNDEMTEIFGQPTALPDLPMIDPDEETGAEQYVLVSFDVTEFGKARNVQILDSGPADSVSTRSKVRKLLRNAKFRPRFAGGEPVLTRGVVQRFVFDD
ncbi:hypothetical protein [Biformimicrobium ophioploci]|uniref:TonB C-terminal domain-containing protein n=1 Tax=Biformimicrobium ophioploci TaxID=3036711 RepID=A0ABQ6LYM7_9GAMM|nr:hypothetical protein [Microbulbifer sp. NKW57]GMG87180.1 hypothetical protein MNKW57_15010 [Microbulbifer sp. NKW57]